MTFLRRVAFRFLVSGTALIGAACAATGPVFSPMEPPARKALIYVYRIAGVVGAGAAFNLKANEKGIAIVGNGGYYAYLSNPGTITFSAKLRPGLGHLLAFQEWDDLLTIEAEPKTVYYVRFRIGPTMELVRADVGKGELRGLKRFDSLGE